MLPYLVCLILLNACMSNGDAFESDVSDTKFFSASLECSPRYKTKDKIECQFFLKNDGQQDISVLKWRTPLEGMTSDCLFVTRNGEKITYDGVIMKRSNPGPEEFVLVAPGKTVSSKFTISEGYDTTLAGTYSVKVDTYIDYAVGSVKGMNEPGKPEIPVKIRKLFSPTASFKVVGRKAGVGTSGQRARSLEKEQKRAMRFRDSEKRNSPLVPVVEGNDAKFAETVEVHEATYNEIVSAISDLKNTVNRLYTWFGADPYLSYVTETYMRMEQGLRSDTITYVFGGSQCSDNTYAYTWKGTRKIYLCGLYEISPSFSGVESKVGVLIHELSHAISYLDDIVYGPSACKDLASSSPSKAAQNADNHQYFVTTK